MALPSPAAERTCLVTGASSGIGTEIARELARRGFGVTLVARRGDRLRKLAADLTASHQVRAEVIRADLADPASRAALAGAVAERGLAVDVLVNNAGVGTFGPVAAADPGAEVNTVRVDVEAVVDLTTRFLPGMVERATGGVLNVASTAAFQPLPGQAGYAAAKAFVLSYGRAIGAELRGSGVTVTTLCPGPVETEFAETAGLGTEAARRAVPGSSWVPASAVAAAGVDGLARGRAVVIPGLINRLGAVGGHLAPRQILLPVLACLHPALRAEPPPSPGKPRG